jgi:hypothetical protein
MTALDRLSGLLRGSLRAAERPFPHSDDLDPVIAGLQRHNKSGTGAHVPEDLQQVAVRKFWETQRFETLKDARLVSFGMCVPSRPSGPCIMEDRQRFQAVLDKQAGVDQWVGEPRWYRRCYQGLVRSYFTYDAKVEHAPAVGKRNWGDLRDYLHDRTRSIVDKQVNPDWVTTAVGNRQLFGDDPCAPYAAEVLSGDTSKIDRLCGQLGVVKSSWFLRELVLAQVRQATKLSHERFNDLIPRLLALLASNLILRDRGLILMLDKYASATQPGINELLRNASVEWWGNPWLPSNETRWGGVVPGAREMVAEWLKREFIEAFFTKLAEDGVGDRRRANFWLRYVKSMDNIQFALGTTALHTQDRDFVVLRRKMKGLYTELKATGRSNNAFIMTLGDLVAVEFGGMGNALYGYDVRKTLPFDASRPVGTTVNAPNSLKHNPNLLRMRHQDGIHGWDKWEDMFEATLKEHFDIRPNAAEKPVAARTAAPMPPLPPAPPHPPAPAPTTPTLFSVLPLSAQTAVIDDDPQYTRTERSFNMVDLFAYARAHELKVEDMSKMNGNLWVRTDDNDLRVNKVLLDWGFRYRPGKGWWR